MKILFNGKKFYFSMSTKEIKTLLSVLKYVVTFIAGVLSHVTGETVGLF